MDTQTSQWENREKYYTAAFAVIFNDEGKVLLCLRRDGKGWDLPGGRREEGETLEECLKREVNEETGLTVEIVRETKEYTKENGRVTKVFIVRVIAGDLTLNEEVVEFDYFDPLNLPENILPKQRQRIADALSALAAG